MVNKVRNYNNDNDKLQFFTKTFNSTIYKLYYQANGTLVGNK